MRRAIARLALACCAAAAATGVLAQGHGLEHGRTNLAALAPIAAESDIMLAPHVVADLMARKVAPNGDPVEAAWVMQLLSFYAAPGAQTLWVDGRGMLPRAASAIDEMRRADDYALDPSAFSTPWLAEGQRDPRALAAAEVKMSLAAAKYAWHARGGRLDPTQLSLWLDYKPRPVNAVDVLSAILTAGDPGAAMRALHPQHPQFEFLRQAYLKERGGSAVSGDFRGNIPMGVKIKPGRRHADVALARLRLSKPASDGDEELLDSDFQQDLYDFMNNVAGISYGRNRGIDDDVRAALNGGTAGSARGGDRAMMDLIRVNMERWRWLPRDMGSLYIWNNLPEFETRVVKDGQVIHRERIVIGQPDTQTPVFSDSMTRVIFKPDWNVPESIKLSSLWGSLRGGDYGVLKRRNMRIMHEGKEVNPAKLKYAELNARDVPIVMESGPGNPLGQFKFVFPNKHDVYMHDTTSKELFESSVRTFSHGCIRVRDPQRFAEVVLGEAKGWNRMDVRWQARVKATTAIELDRPIPIHNTYFTLVADASGSLKKLTDVYGHDRRVGDALKGVDVKKIAANDPAMAQKRKNEELANGVAAVAPEKPVVRRSKPRVASARRAAPPPAAESSFFFRSAPPPPPRPFFAARSGLTRAVRPRGFFFW